MNTGLDKDMDHFATGGTGQRWAVAWSRGPVALYVAPWEPGLLAAPELDTLIAHLQVRQAPTAAADCVIPCSALWAETSPACNTTALPPNTECAFAAPTLLHLMHLRFSASWAVTAIKKIGAPDDARLQG